MDTIDTITAHFPTESDVPRRLRQAVAELRRTTTGELSLSPGFTSGWGNVVFRADCSKGTVAIRIATGPKPEVDSLTWKAEFANTVEAARVGVGPRVLLSNPTIGVIVMEWVDAPHPLDDKQRDYNRIEIGRLLSRLHTEARFLSAFSYSDLLGTFIARAPSPLIVSIYDQLVQLWGALANSTSLCASHNDVFPKHIARLRGKTVLIDWEYSSSNFPEWDLATIALESGLDDRSLSELLVGYYNTPSPPHHAFHRIAAARVLVDALWLAYDYVKLKSYPQDATRFEHLISIREARLLALLRATTFSSFRGEFSTAMPDVEIGVVTPPFGPKLS